MIKLEWTRKASGKARLLSIKDENIIYVDKNNSIHSLNIKDGTDLWHHKYKSGHFIDYSEPHIIDDKVIVSWEKYLSCHDLKTGDLLWEIENTNGKGCEFPEYLNDDESDFCFFLFKIEDFVFFSSYSGIIRKINFSNGEYEILNSVDGTYNWYPIDDENFFLKRNPNSRKFFVSFKNQKLSDFQEFERDGGAHNRCISTDKYFFLEFGDDVEIFERDSKKSLHKITITGDRYLRDVVVYKDNIIIITNYFFICLDSNFKKVWEYENFDINCFCTFKQGFVFDDSSFEGLNYIDYESGEIIKYDGKEGLEWYTEMYSCGNKLLTVNYDHVFLYTVSEEG